MAVHKHDSSGVLSFDVTLSTGDDQHVVIPYACTVTRIDSVIHGAIANANETLTFKNNAGTGLTGGVITVAFSGSADGTLDSVTPTANNTFTAGQKLTCTIAGDATNAIVARLTLYVTLS